MYLALSSHIKQLDNLAETEFGIPVATLMDNAGSQCKFMHCLPAFHDLKTEIGKDIFEKFE